MKASVLRYFAGGNLHLLAAVLAGQTVLRVITDQPPYYALNLGILIAMATLRLLAQAVLETYIILTTKELHR